jgi:hypothetical protein
MGKLAEETALQKLYRRHQAELPDSAFERRSVWGWEKKKACLFSRQAEKI